jgi:excisionase family DNA binding protein
MHPDLLTTGRIAKICRISQQSVIRIAESGELKFYRVPGSTHRRFMVKDVRSFMERHQIPIEWLDEYLQAHRPPTESS